MKANLYEYWGIIRIHVGSIFVVFISSPTPQIYIFDENKIVKCYLSYWNCIHEITSPQKGKKMQSAKIGPHNFEWLLTTCICYDINYY